MNNQAVQYCSSVYLFLISNEAVGIDSVRLAVVMDGINQSYCQLLSSLACLLLLLLAVDFCNYQPKWACRFCFHFVGLTTAFFAFYTPIWVGISLASIAVEAVATFQILGKKINPVTKMSRFTRPFGLGVLAVARTKRQNGNSGNCIIDNVDRNLSFFMFKNNSNFTTCISIFLAVIFCTKK